MNQTPWDHGVFVVTAGPAVLFFPKVRKLLADLHRMESSERTAARFYSVDGEILTVVGDPRTGFQLNVTGESGLDALTAALTAVAGDISADKDPMSVAAHLAAQRPKRSIWPPRR